MFEVAHACNDHRHVMSVTVVDGFLIPLGTAGLDDGLYAVFMRKLDGIRHREESVACHDDIVSELKRPVDCDFQSTDTVHLSRADPHCLPVVRTDDGIAFDV